MIKSSAQMKTMHLIIGIIVAVVLANLPGPGSITQHGMALIGTFIVANYWFIAIDMITGSLASLVMFVLLSGTPAATAIASVFGNTTIWQMLVVLPLIYGLRVTGVDDALTGWMVSRKALRSRPTMFVVFFLLTCSLLCALKVHPLVMLALAESVMSVGGYMERTKEHDAFLVSTFFASALASNIIPYGSWVAGFVASFEAISGVPLDQATYMLFGIALNIVLDILYVVVMSLFLKCDFSRLEKIDLNALQVTQTQFTKRGRFMLLLFLVMIVGAFLPTLFGAFAVSIFINETLTVGLWFTLCLVAALVVPIEGKPVIEAVDSFKNGIIWPLIFTASVMLYYSGIIGSDEAGIRAALSDLFSGVFTGLPGIVLLLCACALTIIVTGFFSNMATGVIFMSATIPLASVFNLSPLVLGVCIMWASQPGYITPGGTGTSPYLHTLTTINEKNKYKFIFVFLAVYLVVLLAFGTVMNAFF